MMKEYIIQSKDELKKIAEELIPFIMHRPVVAIKGKMGSGKTTLIKELCKMLQVTDNVSSPTFALVNEYFTSSGRPVYHFDFYRINSTEEIYDLGYEEYLYSGNFCFIEWPEQAEDVLLPDVLEITIDVDPKNRRIIKIDIPAEAS